MIDETALKLTLLASFQHLRANYELVSSLGCEIAALRETVAGLDPTFAEVLDQKRAVMESRALETISANLSKYDLIIEQLKAGRIVG